MKVRIGSKEYTVKKSSRKGKQFVADGPGIKSPVHFGDSKMREYPGTKRGNSYCARSFGIKGRNNLNSPNFWSRFMWGCKGKKSISRKRFKK